jgi:hypothetical protein
MPDSTGLPPPPSSGAADSLSAGMAQNDQATQALIGQEQNAMQPAMSQAGSLLSKPQPQAPQLQAAPSSPDLRKEQSENASDFFKWAAVVAGIAGAFSRQHVTSALNAFGSTIKGMHQGQLDSAQQAYTEFKQSSDAVKANNDAMQQEYMNAISNRKLSIDEQMQRVQLIATQYHDPLMAEAASGKNFMLVANLVERQREATERFGLASDKLTQQWEQFKEQQSQKIESAGLNTTQGLLNLSDTLSKLPPDKQEQLKQVIQMTHPNALVGNGNEVQSTAKMIADYRMAPLSGFALRSPFGQAVMAQVSQANPDYNAERYNAVNKAVSSFDTGKQGDMVRSFNVAIQHLNTLDQLTTALGTGDVKALNRVSNAYQEQFGGTAPSNFNAAKQIVGQEITKAIVSGGGGVSERQEAEAQLSTAKTPEQLRGVIETYKHLMAGQLTGLRKQYESGTGFKDFDEKLLPDTIKQMKSINSAPGDENEGWKVEEVK